MQLTVALVVGVAIILCAHQCTAMAPGQNELAMKSCKILKRYEQKFALVDDHLTDDAKNHSLHADWAWKALIHQGAVNKWTNNEDFCKDKVVRIVREFVDATHFDHYLGIAEEFHSELEAAEKDLHEDLNTVVKRSTHDLTNVVHHFIRKIGVLRDAMDQRWDKYERGCWQMVGEGPITLSHPVWRSLVDHLQPFKCAYSYSDPSVGSGDDGFGDL